MAADSRAAVIAQVAQRTGIRRARRGQTRRNREGRQPDSTRRSVITRTSLRGRAERRRSRRRRGARWRRRARGCRCGRDIRLPGTRGPARRAGRPASAARRLASVRARRRTRCGPATPSTAPTRSARSPIIVDAAGLAGAVRDQDRDSRSAHRELVDGQPVPALHHGRHDVLVAQRRSQSQHGGLDGVGVGAAAG